MKKLATLIFVIALYGATANLMAQNATETKTKTQTQTNVQSDQKKDDRPHMDDAKKALENAKKQLKEAAHDYNGHRAKALELVDQAIKEINEGLESEKKSDKK